MGGCFGGKPWGEALKGSLFKKALGAENNPKKSDRITVKMIETLFYDSDVMSLESMVPNLMSILERSLKGGGGTIMLHNII